MKQKFIIAQFTPDLGRGYYEVVADEFVTSQFNATRYDNYMDCENVLRSFGSEITAERNGAHKYAGCVYAIQKIYVP